MSTAGTLSSTPAGMPAGASAWPALGHLSRTLTGLCAGADGYLWPILDKVLRFWLGALLALECFSAEEGMPILLLAALAAAGLLLGLGLWTRAAAALGLALRLAGPGLSYDLAWIETLQGVEAILLAAYAGLGAGALSLDNAFEGRMKRKGWRSALSQGTLLCLRVTVAAPLLMAVIGIGMPQALPMALAELAALAAASGPLLALPALLLLSGFGTRVGAALLGVWLLATSGGPALWWLLPLAILLLRGGGRLSLDGVLEQALRRRHPAEMGALRFAECPHLPHVVILGAGFGGIAAARALRYRAVRVTVIDKRNYHLFQPLLYQVATAALSPAEIASPIREMLSDQANARFIYGKVGGVDRVARDVVLESGARIPFDALIVATGARHSYFGQDQWEAFAPGLKKIEDALEIRRRLLLALEQAEAAASLEERAACACFVVVGGGPTGVEMAGAIAELTRLGATGEFQSLSPAETRVLLLEGGPRLLAAFPESLSEVTRRSLEDLGVEVRLNARVEAITAEGVMVAGALIPCRTVIWGAGVAASPAARWLGAAKDRAGRVVVEPDLTLPGEPLIFVIGDTAAMLHGGQPVPGIAPAAKQAGVHAARLAVARLSGDPRQEPFRYRHQGSLATIGRNAAVADLGRVHLTGMPAWWFWGVVHVLFLMTMRNRLAVMLHWIWAYLSWRRGVRLITGGPADPD